MVFSIFVKLTGSAVQAQCDLLTCHKTGRCDGLQNHLDGGLVVGHVGRKAAFVTHGHTHALVIQDFLQRVEYFSAVTHGFTKARRAQRDDHELLQIKIVVGVCAAIDHVHHGHRHLHAAHAAKVAVQRQAGLFRRRAGHGHRHCQHGVGTQARLVLGAVQVDQGFVKEGLFGRVQPQHGLRDLGVDELHGFQHALAKVAGLVPIAQLDGFA